MKKFTILLLIGIFNCLAVQAQNITISPNKSDFCQNALITYTAFPSPSNYIIWEVETYNDFSMTGQPDAIVQTSSGNVFTINTNFSFACPGTRVRVIEYDILNNIFNYNSIAFVTSEGNIPIPMYFSYNNCGELSVPNIFDPWSAFPGAGTRWAMWYKNGVPTGISSMTLSGPLTDSAWYEYKVKLQCGDTITTGPQYYNRPSKPTITAAGATTICTGDSVTLNANSSITIDYWMKNGVAIVGSNGKTSIKATESGSYSLRGKYPTGGGTNCFLISDPISINVNPGAFITGNIQACNGDSIQLTCTAANSYSWKRNGVTISGATTQSIWVKISGNYTVNTTGITCNSSVIKNVTFYNNPSSLTVSPSGLQTLCAGSAITLSVAGNNMSTWQWTRNGALLNGATSSKLVCGQAGFYRCTVSNVMGCTKTTSSVQINAAAATTLPQKSITIKPGSEGIDSYVTTAFGNFSTNFGTTPTIEVSNWYKYFRTAEYGILNFDLSNIVPDYNPIASATLTLWIDTINKSNVYANLPNSIFIKRNINSWAENTISYNSKPATTQYQSAAIPCSTLTSKSFFSASVTNLVRHWLFQPTEKFGVTIQFEDFWQISWASIASSDNSNAGYRPKLVINYYYADIIANGNLNFCTGGNVTFTTNSGSFTKQWYKNGLPISGATTSNYTATTAGDYFVMLTDANGCAVKSLTKKVTINATPQINITPADSAKFCNGSSITLIADSLQGYTFQWKRNNINITGAVYRTLNTTQQGDYKIKTTSNCGVVGFDSVYVTKITNPNAVITAAGPTTFCQGQSVTLNSNTFAGVTFKWYRDNTYLSNAQYYVAAYAGNHRVEQTASGCTKVSNIITVSINCREGEFAIDEPTISIYPNPTSSNVNIEISNENNFVNLIAELYDFNGRKIESYHLKNNYSQLDLSNFADGFYLLKTMHEGKLVGTNKILIQH
jgi:hypothetical protein